MNPFTAPKPERGKPHSHQRKGITFRFPAPLYDALTESADRNQRTVTREIEVRLTRSVDMDLGRGGREVAAFLDHLGAMAQLIGSTMEAECPAARAFAIETAFNASITRFLRQPLEAARDELAKDLKPPRRDLYLAAAKVRLKMGARDTDVLDSEPLAPHDAVAPALLQFIADPPTRTVSGLEDILSRRAILEKASVPKELFAAVVGQLNFEEVKPRRHETEGVKNGAVDALKQEELHGLRPEGVTEAEWAWAEDYDACLRGYKKIEAIIDEAQSAAFAALQEIEERYGFKFSGAV
ncbi:MAG: hypothetical protein ACFE0P_10520 [Oceanicaulis sp.]